LQAVTDNLYITVGQAQCSDFCNRTVSVAALGVFWPADQQLINAERATRISAHLVPEARVSPEDALMLCHAFYSGFALLLEWSM
jgi:hypothetical protein